MGDLFYNTWFLTRTTTYIHCATELSGALTSGIQKQQ